jgi:hypothetical protein
MFADRFQGLLFTSLQAPDRRQLQEVLVKLNREEKQREWKEGGGGRGRGVAGGGSGTQCNIQQHI